MKLYGSFTSPYVRRLRILLGEQDYEFIDAPTSTPEGRAILSQVNPTMKIPMFEDKGEVLCDSGLIAQYLHDKLDIPALSYHDLNIIKIIDAITDSYIQLFLLSHSGFDTNESKMYFNLQRERIERSFTFLENLITTGMITSSNWNYMTISLVTSIEWLMVRQLHDFSDLPALSGFYNELKLRDDMVSTQIPV
ncbi:glutathione S-transferase family protein [Glaciecola sp. HTCC2999]|uniref:glutathione S-transferase family protein n=1 Tax=Glaciecola sp. HTCC2999 TaxID=455436 RepID=UPI0000E0EF00|nr:glutathione S-transferase N-terminal domain-containing protein [Glaciecola sp. HTCC2999]